MRPGAPGERSAFRRPPRLLESSGRGGEIRSTTGRRRGVLRRRHDLRRGLARRAWTASRADLSAPPPASSAWSCRRGEHRLACSYRDPFVRVWAPPPPCRSLLAAALVYPAAEAPVLGGATGVASRATGRGAGAPGAAWIASLFAPLAVAGPGAGQPRHRHLPSAAARLVPRPRGLRPAGVEPLAARRPAHPLEPQLRRVLSAELAGLRRAAPLRPEPAGDVARGLAFAGAWRLARRLGCGRGAGGAGGDRLRRAAAPTSPCSAPFNLFWSWPGCPGSLPGETRPCAPPLGERWWRPALLAGGALGLQLLNGEPSTVVMSGLALLALAVSVGGAPRARPRPGGR